MWPMAFAVVTSKADPIMNNTSSLDQEFSAAPAKLLQSKNKFFYTPATDSMKVDLEVIETVTP